MLPIGVWTPPDLHMNSFAYIIHFLTFGGVFASLLLPYTLITSANVEAILELNLMPREAIHFKDGPNILFFGGGTLRSQPDVHEENLW